MFAVALLASGVSSSSVGTLAGHVVMAGFVRIRISLAVRRLISMLPSLAVLAVGLNSTDVLNASQVVLSFGIPFAHGASHTVLTPAYPDPRSALDSLARLIR